MYELLIAMFNVDCEVEEAHIKERINNVCQGGVDVVIDFVSSVRTISRATKVLTEVKIKKIKEL